MNPFPKLWSYVKIKFIRDISHVYNLVVQKFDYKCRNLKLLDKNP